MDQATKKKSTSSVFRKWILPLASLGLLLLYLLSRSAGPQEISWQEFKTKMLLAKDVAGIVIVDKERVEVYIKPDSLQKSLYQGFSKSGAAVPGPHFFFKIGSIESFEQRLDAVEAGLPESDKISVRYSSTGNLGGLLIWIIPLTLLILWFSFLGRVSGRAGSPLDAINFSKSSVKEYQKGKKSQITFKEVAGYEEAKIEVMEVVDFLKNPAAFTKIGAKIPKGILLVGPPGTGKTLMAKAVAGEAEVPFFSLSGSEFIEMFVGVGASRVRDLFDRAKAKAPSIIFIDEIDTIGRTRGRALSAQVNDERESTLNQLLAEMDGFDPSTGVIVMAATNRADIMDAALLRAGRFDRHVYLELPNKQEREAIFEVHLRPLSLDRAVDKKLLAALTPGFSGADIANVCNEAALIAARQKKQSVDADDFSDAIDRIVAGPQKKTRIITPAEKKIVAFHEAGHALVSWVLPDIDPLMKVSIIPRGKSLGGAWFLPEERQIIPKTKFTNQLCATLAGRAAEELIFSEISSGALDDLEKATKQAYNMVVMLGLSPRVGNLSYYDSTGTYDNGFQKPYSEAMSRVIDEEVQLLLKEAYERAIDILRQSRGKLELLASALLEHEVLNKEDIELILGARTKKAPGLSVLTDAKG